MQIRTSSDIYYIKKNYSFEHTDSRVSGHCHNALHLFWHFSGSSLNIFRGRGLIAGQQKGYSLECQCFSVKRRIYIMYTILSCSNGPQGTNGSINQPTMVQGFRPSGKREHVLPITIIGHRQLPEWPPGVPPIAPKFHSPSAGASGSRIWRAAPNSAESRHRGKQVRQLKLPPFVPATWAHSRPSVRGKRSHPPLVNILRP